jgi:hypothetical protein
MSEVLPGKVKRVFYVSSALAVVIRDRTPDTETLSKLGRFLKLGYQPEAMLFPAYMAIHIWKNLDLHAVKGFSESDGLHVRQMTDKDYWELALTFARQCPDFLQYGSLQLMTTDAHNMLRVVSNQQMVVIT